MVLAGQVKLEPPLEVVRFAFFDHFPYTTHVEVGVYLRRALPGVPVAATASASLLSPQEQTLNPGSS